MTVVLFGRTGHYSFNPEDRTSFIGRGGMSNVFKGKRISDSLDVAIKVLHANMAQNQFVQFITLISSTVTIQHHNVMKMIELIVQNEIYHLICKFYPGRLLSSIIEDKNSIAPNQSENWKIISGILDGLYALHSNFPKIIHRDIKPSNIVVTPNFVPVIIDFGIAKVDIQRMVRRENDLESNRSLGTFNYSSPEQLNGEDIDQTTDLYSAGILFYSLLCKIHQQRDTVLIFPLKAHPYLSDKILNILRKATDKNPINRYQDANSLKHALHLEFSSFWSNLIKWS